MYFKYCFLLFLMAVLLSGCAASQTQGAYAKRNHKADVIRGKNLRQFQKIQASFDQQDYQVVAALLDQLSEQPKLNFTELSYIDSYRGNLCFVNKDMHCLIREYEKVLPRRARIPQSFYRNILKTLADAHFNLQQYAQSISYAEQLRDISFYYSVDELTVFIGRAHYQSKNYHAALATILPVIRAADASGQFFKSAWLTLVIDTYKELDRLDEASEFIDSIVTDIPKVKHKMRIAEHYGELGRTADKQRIEQPLIEQGLAAYKDGRLIVWKSDGERLPIYRPPAIYPRKAAHRRLNGSVDLKLDIDKLGKTKNIRVTTARPKDIFDAAAINAASAYLFEPAIENGKVVEVKDHEIRIVFEMEGSRR